MGPLTFPSRWYLFGFTISALVFFFFFEGGGLNTYLGFDTILDKHGVLSQNHLTKSGVTHASYKDCEISTYF